MEQKTFRCDPLTAVVETTLGPVRGYVYRGLTIFKGIPYAHARRFHMPEKLSPWREPLETVNYGCVCPLVRLPRPNGELLIAHRYWPMDEDCLNLNVWTPGCDGKKRPVLVWFHGGGFMEGSAIEQLAYEGENLSLCGDVVVVSVNHRLNVLGYCDLSAFGEAYANSANAGTMDLVAALEWVRDEIAAFGGDPENVTIFGQSGGGGKVNALLQTPAADGLYRQAVNMSGVIGALEARDTGDTRCLGDALMKDLGMTSAEALEQVPWRSLLDAYARVSPALQQSGAYAGGGPLKNAFYAGDAVQYGFRPETAQVPMLIGTMYGEFMGFIPIPKEQMEVDEAAARANLERILGKKEADALIPLFAQAYPDRPLRDLIKADCLFRGGSRAYIAGRSELNQVTWSYMGDFDMPVDGGRPAWHCADIPFFFHNTELLPLYAEGEDMAYLEKMFFQTLLSFARTGNPNSDVLPDWPACGPDGEYTMLFGPHPHVTLNHDHAFLDAYAPQAGKIMADIMKANQDRIAH